MLLLKRIATSVVLFVFLFVVVYFAICMVGGAISAVISGTGNPNPHDAYDEGRQAGANFVRHNIRLILLSSLLISIVSSLLLSFSGILPWCRRPPQPPPLQPPPL
jgi:hypothetical protein